MNFRFLENSGLIAVILHRIRTFCPTIEALAKAAPKNNDQPEDRDTLRDGTDGLRELEDTVVRWNLSQRPMFDIKHKRWVVTDGFAPSVTVGPSVATLFATGRETPFALRLLRQGIGVFAQASVLSDEDELVEPRPRNVACGDANMQEALSLFQKQLGLPTEETLIEDVSHKLKVYAQQAYKVAEFIFKDEESLTRLSDVHSAEAVDDHLVDAILYCLSRSYALDSTDRHVSLKEIVTEINKDAFDIYFTDAVAGTGQGAQPRRLINQSQSKRAFVALGARGAVLGHTIGHYDHPYLRTAVLNLIDILRGRYHNLVLARTVADNVIRKLSRALPGIKPAEPVNPDELLKKMAEANYLYGLVVSDPSVYLLDGSTLSRLVVQADTCFQLQSLREDTERKMNALQRLWQSYQDKARTEIIKTFSLERSRENTPTQP